MAIVELNAGKFAEVDDVDAAIVSLYKWRVKSLSRKIYYATTWVRQVDGSRRGLLLHRLLLPNTLMVDHIDGNGLNNKRENLRPATPSENSCNSHGWRKRKNLYKGIFRNHKGWGATITKDGRKHHLGTYATQEKAAKAYDAAARHLHGQFAKLNFPVYSGYTSTTMGDRTAPRKDPMCVLWASSNRNALTNIARDCGVTPQFVHYVLYGLRRSKEGKVERLLRELGAPIKSQ